MFRLPTHLESFVPPPNQQMPQTRPWRGTLVLTSPASPPGNVIYCTAAEAEGDNQAEMWSSQLVVQILSQRPLLPQIQAWVKAHMVPMCMFMPDRLPDQDSHNRNLASFEELAATLFDNQFIAIAYWNTPEGLMTGSILLFPTATSRALLVGAVFIHPEVPFPDFLGVNPRSHAMPVSRGISFSTPGNSPYDPAPPNIAASQRYSRGGGGSGQFAS